MPLETRRTGIEIGDVGIVTPDGCFDVIFNICRTADDPVNRFGVPEAFEQIPLSNEDIRTELQYHQPGSIISNAIVNRQARAEGNARVFDSISISTPHPIVYIRVSPEGEGSVELTTSSKETAMLCLPDGASRVDLIHLHKFRDYALKHAQGWYKFVNKDLERIVDNGELYLITGTDKSMSWSVAAIQSQSETSVKLKVTQSGSGRTSWEWQTGSSFADSGPNPVPGEEDWTNQTVFLRGFKVAIRSISSKDSRRSRVFGALIKQFSLSGFFRGAFDRGRGTNSTTNSKASVEYFPGSKVGRIH